MEEEEEEFLQTKQMLSDEAIRSKFLYRINEEENLKIDSNSNVNIEALADKHWKKFQQNLSTTDTHSYPTESSNVYNVLYRIAAAFLFIVNPWMIYKSFEASLAKPEALLNSNQSFLFSSEISERWKDISIEWSISLITFPVILFLLAFTLSRKKQITPAYFLLFSLSVSLSWGYYILTNSDSVLPIFLASLIALFGILFFIFKGFIRKEV
jgi:hypothetical protein